MVLWNTASFYLDSSHEILALVQSSLMFSKPRLNFKLTHQVPVSCLREVFSFQFIWEAGMINMQVSPTFQKFILFHSVFANRKKSKEDFCFCEKSIQHLFVFCLQQPLQRQRTPPAPSLGTTLSISAQNWTVSVSISIYSVLYLDLFCAPISKMCPKVIVSSLYAISA